MKINTMAAAVAAFGANQPRADVGEMEMEGAPAPVPSMSYDDWMKQCQAILPEGAVMKPGCAYEAGGASYFQACSVENGVVVKVGDPVKMSGSEPAQAAPAAEVAELQAKLEATIADLNGAIGDRSQALAAANVKPDLRDFAEASLVRGSGETWSQAVANLKAARPSLFEAPAAQSEIPATPEVKEKPVAHAPDLTPMAALPAGHELHGSKEPAANVGANKSRYVSIN